MSWGREVIKTFINLKFKVVTLNVLLPPGILPREKNTGNTPSPFPPFVIDNNQNVRGVGKTRGHCPLGLQCRIPTDGL